MPTWTCPFCQQNASLVDKNISIQYHQFSNGNKYKERVAKTVVIVCPNSECKEFTLRADLITAHQVNRGGYFHWEDDELFDSWQLIPQSEAKVFPDYLPKAIRDDYNEACLIRSLSPKSSATLARRCLQGILRDFYGEAKNRLVDEIAAVQSKMDPLTWRAVDAVRQVGNIGAHMEKDINIIVEVDPQEAQILIGLIELLVKDTYILRHEREQQLNAVIQLSDDKKAAKITS